MSDPYAPGMGDLPARIPRPTQEPECPNCGSLEVEVDGDEWEWTTVCSNCGRRDEGGRL